MRACMHARVDAWRPWVNLPGNQQRAHAQRSADHTIAMLARARVCGSGLSQGGAASQWSRWSCSPLCHAWPSPPHGASPPQRSAAHCAPSCPSHVAMQPCMSGRQAPRPSLHVVPLTPRPAPLRMIDHSTPRPSSTVCSGSSSPTSSTTGTGSTSAPRAGSAEREGEGHTAVTV